MAKQTTERQITGPDGQPIVKRWPNGVIDLRPDGPIPAPRDGPVEFDGSVKARSALPPDVEALVGVPRAPIRSFLKPTKPAE